jgi:DNA-binding transcriptional regulator YiaG
MGVLRAEIRRLARKETKQEMADIKKQLTVLRRRLAEWNRRMQGVEARARQLMKSGSRAAPRGGAADDEGEDEKQVRFSPMWVRTHRKKLGMSRQLYARLVGVSAQTIMGWEAGRTRPRRTALRNWRAIRAKGVRELRAMLGGGEGAAGLGRGARSRRRARRKVRKAVRRVRARVRARVRKVVRTVRRARVVRAVRKARSTRGGRPRRARAAKKK